MLTDWNNLSVDNKNLLADHLIAISSISLLSRKKEFLK